MFVALSPGDYQKAAGFEARIGHITFLVTLGIAIQLYLLVPRCHFGCYILDVKLL